MNNRRDDDVMEVIAFCWRCGNVFHAQMLKTGKSNIRCSLCGSKNLSIRPITFCHSLYEKIKGVE